MVYPYMGHRETQRRRKREYGTESSEAGESLAWPHSMPSRDGIAMNSDLEYENTLA